VCVDPDFLSVVYRVDCGQFGVQGVGIRDYGIC